MTAPIKILMILTSHAAMGDTGEQTGVWLEELTTPYYAFVDAGAQVTVASIDGGAVPVDPRSLKAAGENDASVERYLGDATLKQAVSHSIRLEPGMTGGYDALFLPGGHGTMWDLPASAILATTVSRYMVEGKVVAAVCHGPAGLVSARLPNGDPLVKGRKIAGFSNSEEIAAGLDKTVPFLLETRLRDLGGLYASGPDFAPFAVRDGALVTGQNPASAKEAARLTLEAIAEARSVHPDNKGK